MTESSPEKRVELASSFMTQTWKLWVEEGMTVKALIEGLKDLPPDALISDESSIENGIYEIVFEHRADILASPVTEHNQP